MGDRRRYVAIVAASLLVAVQAFTASAALAASPTTTRILYTPPPSIAVGTPAAFTAKIEPDITDLTVSWYVDGAVATTDLTNPNGVSQVSLTLGVGVHGIKAVLEPSVDWEGSESDVFSLTVLPDLLFLDGTTGDGITSGIPRTISSPDEGILYGNISPYVTTPGAGLQFLVDPVDATKDGSHWFVEFGAPPGEILTPGTYSATQDPRLATGLAYFRVSGNGRGCTSTAASFHVLEAAFDSAGVPTRFAADFSQTCGDTLHGEIRFHSIVGVRARDLAPLTSDVGGVLVGQSSSPVNVVVTNTGTIDLHPIAPLTSGAIAVSSDACTGSAVVPGATCQIGVRLVPAAGGPQFGDLTFRDDTIQAEHRIRVGGSGIMPTVTNLTSTVNPNISPNVPTTLIATVTPTPESGFVDFYFNGTLGFSRFSRTGVFTLSGVSLVAGSTQLTAVFRGHPYFAPSTSNVVTQHTNQRVDVDFWATPMSAPVGHPIAIGSDLQAVSPISGGTVTIVDTSTGATIASLAQPGPDYFACLGNLGPGLHHLVATFSGAGPDLPSSTAVDVTVVPGDVVLGRGSNDAVPAGPAWCGTLRTPTGATSAPTTMRDLYAFAVGPDPFTLVRLSNSAAVDGTGRLVNGIDYPYGSSIAWSLINPATGGTNIDRNVVVSWQVKSGTGPWSRVFQQAFRLDRVAPSGTVSIASGATWTKTTAVTIGTVASDTGSGVSQVALSNDGTNWTTRPHGSNQAWTLLPTNGTRTVWVKWKDAAGNWSAVKTDTIVLDTVAPTATGPTWKIGSAGSALVSGSIPVVLSWTGSDATSGIDHYLLSQSIDGGVYTSVSSSLTATTMTRDIVPGHNYRFAICAVDKAGNVGALYYGLTFRLTGLHESNAAIHYVGTWPTSISTTWWGGTAKGSSQAGASASLTFTGRSFAWISLKASNRGQARVYVNGVLTATVDLYSATLQKQRVGWSATWSSSATRTVLIKVVGTATRPRIDVDGFFTGN